MFTIGQLAERTGVSVEAIRFYERKGLIQQPRRPTSGFRRYPDTTAERIDFIRRAAVLGLTLSEIAELLALRARPSASCGSVRTRARAKVAEIDGRLAELQRIRRALVRLADACEGDRVVSQCSILSELAGDASTTTESGEPR